MGAPRQACGDSLTPQERLVLRLWDEGRDLSVIAARVGIRRKQVSSIVSTYSDGGETRAHLASTAQGSAALLAAMGAA